jgi:hypothetical protein
MSCGIPTFHVNEDTSPTIMYRMWDHEASGITETGTDTIFYAVHDIDDSDTAVVESTELTVAEVVSDTYQTDARWTKDTTGYNFLWPIPAEVIPEGDKTYQVALTFTPSSGGPIVEAFRLKTRQIH